MFGLDHRQQVLVVICWIVIFFMFWARLDFVLGPREYVLDSYVVLPFVTVGEHWFWMWIVGYPLLALAFSSIYYAGASDTERNAVYAVGVFVTVIVLAVCQLEDFFWHIVNPEISWLPNSQNWSYWGWSAENNIWWALFGNWTNIHHWILLSVGVCSVVVLWYYLLVRYEP